MTTRSHPVVLLPGDCARRSVHTFRVHHRDFPEGWAEGGTPAEAAHQLTHHLARALDSAGGQWHRAYLVEALADVHTFIESLGPAEHPHPQREEPVPC